MTCDELQHLLRTTGRYQTPPNAAFSTPARADCLTRFRYHWGMLSQIVGAWRLARKGEYNAKAWAEHSFNLMLLVERSGATVTYEGFLPCSQHVGAVVYAANHMSTLETTLLPSLLTSFGPLSIVLKESLTHYPLFGTVCRSIDPIVVSRKNARADFQAVMEQGRVRLAAGKSVLLFPQATRDPVFRATRFNSMAAKLAQAAGVPLIPIALQTDCIGCGRWLKDFGPVDPSKPVRIACGPFLSPTLSPRDLQQQCVNWIAEQLQGWGLPVDLERRHSDAQNLRAP